ncbi:MAG: beta-lactamase family protein [Ignavibacteria bacterium]|nr:beta-lactamase family protein [Ignavibacteria bacterium]
MQRHRFLPIRDGNQNRRRILVIFILCLSFGLLSCDRGKSVLDATAEYQYEVPPQTGDGWETSSLASVGMDEVPLINLMQTLNGMNDHRIHSVLIVKDGKLVFEEYFQGSKFNLAQYTGETGFDRDDTHNLCSVTKSFTSALIGIAMDKGFIESIDQKVFDFFPEHSDLLTNAPGKRDVTLKHLLTMTSGLQWDDETYSYFDPRNDMYQLFNHGDPIKYILSKDLIEIPGTVFAYRSCNTNILGEIVHKATEQRLDMFAENYLFSELGITDYEWQMLPNEVVFCSGDLRLRPRDMAKFGYLFLNGGMWADKRIISQEWIDISTHKHIDRNNFTAAFDWADGYGYQWWVWEDIYGVEYPAYFASGWGGQWIIVCPSMNTVVVSTAGNYYTETKIPIESILVHYVIPSVLHK